MASSSRVIYQRILTTKLLEDKDLEGCILWLASIVCKKYFLFQVEIYEKNVTETVVKGTVLVLVPHIRLIDNSPE